MGWISVRSSTALDTSALEKTLSEVLQKDWMQSNIACLDWFLHLFKMIPNKVRGAGAEGERRRGWRAGE